MIKTSTCKILETVAAGMTGRVVVSLHPSLQEGRKDGSQCSCSGRVNVLSLSYVFFFILLLFILSSTSDCKNREKDLVVQWFPNRGPRTPGDPQEGPRGSSAR